MCVRVALKCECVSACVGDGKPHAHTDVAAALLQECACVLL